MPATNNQLVTGHSRQVELRTCDNRGQEHTVELNNQCSENIGSRGEGRSRQKQLSPGIPDGPMPFPSARQLNGEMLRYC